MDLNNIKLLGRYHFDKHYYFYNGGSGFSFKVKGSGFAINLKSTPVEGYFYIILDHDYSNKIKVITSECPYKYQLKIRINRAIEMLENTPITISDCAESVGFSDPAHFSKIFKQYTGHTPTYYKK